MAGPSSHRDVRPATTTLSDLDEALRLDPTLAEARLLRAGARSRGGDRPGAQADLAQLDTALPPSSPLRADMAQLHAHFAQMPEALRQYELWIGSHPKDIRLASILNSRCWMRARLNIDLPLALHDCQEAVERYDGSAHFFGSLGWTYLRLGDAANAKRAFDRAIKLEELPFSLYGRGLARLRLNDTANGERTWRPPGS